jgi:hypothetical protein
MIDADRYWAASGLSIGKSLSASSRSKSRPTSGITAEQLDGGCLLYRLPVTIGMSDAEGASARASLARHPPPECW